MKEPVPIAKCLCGAEEIAAFIKESPNRIKYLVEHEKLPAWRRNDRGTWRSTDLHLTDWLMKQAKKYCKNAKPMIEDI